MIFFSLKSFFEPKKLSFDDFSMMMSEREKKSEKKKEPQISPLGDSTPEQIWVWMLILWKYDILSMKL